MKIRRRTWIIVLPLIGLIALSTWYLRSDAFQEYVRASLVSRIEKATGLNCRIEHLEFSVLRGKFHISGFSLSPRAGSPDLLKLNVQEINAALSISSFWHQRVRLGELQVIRPRVELASGRGESSWNPEELLSNLKLSLRLEASKVAVEDGWLKVNDRAAPFHIALDDLDCEVRYSRKSPPSYDVRLMYAPSRIFWEQRDFIHGLQLGANLSLEGLSIDSFRFRRGNTILSGTGSIKNWRNPAVDIHLAGNMDAADLKLTHPSLYEGRGNLQIVADMHSDKSGIHSKGRFTAKNGGYRKMDYRSLTGIYEIQNDVLHLRNVSGKIADGTYLVNAEIQLKDSNKDPNKVVILTRNVPVIDAGRLLNLPEMNFENTADTNATLTWYGGKELRADCDSFLHGTANPPVQGGRSTLLEGRIRFTYFESGRLNIESADLSSPSTNVQASGGRGDLFRVQLSTNRISEPFDLIAGFSPPVAEFIREQQDLREMAGRFSFNGDVLINSSSDVQYRGSLSIQHGHWRSYKVDSLAAQTVFTPPRLELHSLVIRERIQSVEGDLDLALGDDEQISGFGFKGKVDRISLAALKEYGLDTSEVDGTLSGSGSVRFENNSWEGQGQFSIQNGRYAQESFDSLHAQLAVENKKLRISQAEARRGSSMASVAGQVALDSRQLNLTTRVQGFSIQEIPLIQKKKIPVRGNIQVSGALKGTIEKPVFAGSFEADALRYESKNLGTAGGRIEFESGRIRGDARIRAEFGTMSIQANIGTSSGFPGQVNLGFENLDVQKIAPSKAPPYLENLSTALQGKIEAQGNFEDLSSLRLRGEVDGARFKIREYELKNTGPIRFSVINKTLLVTEKEGARFTGEGTSLYLNGSIPFVEGMPLELNLNGKLNLEILGVIENKLHASGTANLNIRASGSRYDPQIIGQASFQDAKLDQKDFPFRFSGMQGDIIFSRNLVRFENVRGSAGTGAVQLSGIIEHQNAVLRSINMGIGLRNVRLPYPKDFKSVANADLVLSGSGDAQILSGDIEVLRMEYLRGFNLLEQLASRSTDPSGPLTTEPYLLGLRLNLEVHSDNGLSIDNELTRMRGDMRLSLRGTPAYPSLTGRVEATEGTIFFRGNRFEISRAAADFVDRNRINPVLEIRAEADVKTYRLILDASGDLDHLNLNVTSDPPMSTVDILSLLTTGKTETSTGTSQRESQMAGMSAASVLSENFTGVIGKRVQRIFGLESFRVDPFLAGAENDPTARITISERISKDLMVTFSRNLTTNQEQIVVIEYDVAKNVSVVATRDENGKFGLDFRFRKHIR